MKKFIIILIVAVAAIYLVHSQLKGIFYRAISQETLVGVIRCSTPTEKKYDFYLFYFPVKDGQLSDFRLLKLKGREWIFEGEIIKWKKPLNFLGLHTLQRPAKIYDGQGNCLSLEEKYGKSAFALKRLLPLIDTAYRSLVKQYCSTKIKFGIFATNTGYLVRKIK